MAGSMDQHREKRGKKRSGARARFRFPGQQDIFGLGGAPLPQVVGREPELLADIYHFILTRNKQLIYCLI